MDISLKELNQLYFQKFSEIEGLSSLEEDILFSFVNVFQNTSVNTRNIHKNSDKYDFYFLKEFAKQLTILIPDQKIIEYIAEDLFLGLYYTHEYQLSFKKVPTQKEVSALKGLNSRVEATFDICKDSLSESGIRSFYNIKRIIKNIYHDYGVEIQEDIFEDRDLAFLKLYYYVDKLIKDNSPSQKITIFNLSGIQYSNNTDKELRSFTKYAFLLNCFYLINYNISENSLRKKIKKIRSHLRIKSFE